MWLHVIKCCNIAYDSAQWSCSEAVIMITVHHGSWAHAASDLQLIFFILGRLPHHQNNILCMQMYEFQAISESSDSVLWSSIWPPLNFQCPHNISLYDPSYKFGCIDGTFWSKSLLISATHFWSRLFPAVDPGSRSGCIPEASMTLNSSNYPCLVFPLVIPICAQSH